MAWIFLNDQIKNDTAQILSVCERGFTLGDGVFTTLRANKGEPEFLNAHLARLLKSTQFFKIPFELSEATLATQCKLLLAKNKLAGHTAALRITVTRGVGSRGLDFPKTSTPTVLITATPYEVPVGPVKVIISSFVRSSFSVCSHHKTLNYLENIMAREAARSQGADDALLCNEKGEVVCTTNANVFFESKGQIVTPALKCGALAGVMRNQVIDKLKKQKKEVLESVIRREELQEFDRCFITNSLIGEREVDFKSHE